MEKWISKDIMPKEFGEYIVTTAKGFVQTAFYYDGIWRSKGFKIDIVAWMEKPEAFKEN